MTEAQIKEYRRLLNLYYEATADREEEKKLMEMTDSLDIEACPQDLRGDVKILKETFSLKRDAIKFSSCLNDIITAHPEVSPRRKLKYWIWSVSGIAAAAMIIVAYFAFSKKGPSNSLQNKEPIVQISKIEETAPRYSEPISPVSSSKSEIQMPISLNKKRPFLKTEVAESQSYYIEITDSAEARRVIEESFTLLSENLIKSQSSIRESTELLNNKFKETERQLNILL